jgi:hypothetical protein
VPVGCDLLDQSLMRVASHFCPLISASSREAE